MFSPNHLERWPADMWYLITLALPFLRRSGPPRLRVGQVWQCREQRFWVKILAKSEDGYYGSIRTNVRPNFIVQEVHTNTFEPYNRDKSAYYVYDKENHNDFDLVQLLREA